MVIGLDIKQHYLLMHQVKSSSGFSFRPVVSFVTISSDLGLQILSSMYASEKHHKDMKRKVNYQNINKYFCRQYSNATKNYGRLGIWCRRQNTCCSKVKDNVALIKKNKYKHSGFWRKSEKSLSNIFEFINPFQVIQKKVRHLSC